MTAEEYCDHLFGVATGWLGWSPREALRTPIPQIIVALRARIEWIAMSNGKSLDAPEDRIRSQLKKLAALHG